MLLNCSDILSKSGYKKIFVDMTEASCQSERTPLFLPLNLQQMGQLQLNKGSLAEQTCLNNPCIRTSEGGHIGTHREAGSEER